MPGSRPIVLVPGFWLGAWAWDEVAATLRGGGHDVTALTLPGLESADADRSSITLSDHVDAICDAVQAAGPPVVLAVHSGAGMTGYAATDRIHEQVAAMVYVDTAPGKGSVNPDFEGDELPLAPTWEELGENLDGISEAVAVGIPDPEWGEVLAVVVVREASRPGHAPTVSGLREQLRGILPDSALPRALLEVDAIPVRGPGKPDRAAIRALFAAVGE